RSAGTCGRAERPVCRSGYSRAPERAERASGRAASAQRRYWRPDGWRPSSTCSSGCARVEPVTSSVLTPARAASSRETALKASISRATRARSRPAANGVAAREADCLREESPEGGPEALDRMTAILIVDADQEGDQIEGPARPGRGDPRLELVRRPAGASDDLGLVEGDSLRAQKSRELHRPALGRRHPLADRVGIPERQKPHRSPPVLRLLAFPPGTAGPLSGPPRRTIRNTERSERRQSGGRREDRAAPPHAGFFGAGGAGILSVAMSALGWNPGGRRTLVPSS